MTHITGANGSIIRSMEKTAFIISEIGKLSMAEKLFI
jgi:hypothetical protein